MTEAPRDKSRPTPPPPELPTITRVAPPLPGKFKRIEKKTFALEKGKKQPIIPNIVIQTVEGFGKTTIGAYAPTPLILQIGQERGYQTLLDAGSVPECYTAEIDDWKTLTDTLEDIADPKNQYDFQTLVIDSLAGAAELCRKYVCTEHFGGDWGHGTQTGYAAFSKGDNAVAPAYWRIFDSLLCKINKAGIIVIQIAHTVIEKFENPMGEEESRYTSSIIPKFWEQTKRNADVILFGKFGNTREKDGTENMDAIVERYIYAEQRDAFHAKNRFNMLPSFKLPRDPAKGWETIWAEIHRGIKRDE